MNFLTNFTLADFLGDVLRGILRAVLRAGVRNFFVMNPFVQDTLVILIVGFLQPGKISPTSATQSKRVFWVRPVCGPELRIIGQSEDLLHEISNSWTHYFF